MVEEIPPEVTIKYIKVQSLIDSHFIYDGRASGKRYEWLGGGAIVDVLPEDVPELLEKRLGKSLCCGNSQDGNRVFQVVGENLS